MPELWRDGIDAATGDVVWLTISVMRPAADWLATARRLAGEASAVGGAIEPGEGLRLRDWAEYFCRYARDMLPVRAPARPSTSPATTPSTHASALERDARASTATASGSRRSTECSKELGRRLLHSPELVVYQGRSAGFGAFMRQRLAHGRTYGRQRGARFSTARNVAGVPAAVAGADCPAGEDAWRGLLATSASPEACCGDAAAAGLRHRLGGG